MQRGIEILNGIPYLVVAILAMVVFDPGIITITIAIGLTGWTFMARIVRGRMLQLKNQEFTLASRSLGASGFRLVWKHLIPNSLGLIVINLMFTIPAAIFAEAFLSFIGLGIQVPEASLGFPDKRRGGRAQVPPLPAVAPGPRLLPADDLLQPAG